MEASQTPQDDPQTQQPAADPSDQSNLASAQPDQPVPTPSEGDPQTESTGQDAPSEPSDDSSQAADEGLQPQPSPQEAEELRRQAERSDAAEEHRERVSTDSEQSSDQN